MARYRTNRGRYDREVGRYTRKTLQRDREYGFYWYAWLWRALRPMLVFLCSLVIVAGLVASGLAFVNQHFFMPTEPGNNAVVDFTIEKGSTITQISNKLYEEKLVRNKGIFKYIVQFKGLTGKIQYGSYPLTRNMDVNQVIDKLSEGSASNERTITVIPGWTVEDIADYLVKQGALADKAEFLTLCNDIDHFAPSSYALQNAKAGGKLSGRRYLLEGYLAPDTYRVYTNANAESILLTLLKQTDIVTDSVFNTAPVKEIVYDEFGQLLGEDGEEAPEDGETGEDEEAPEEDVIFNTTLTDDETIILASIIEREAGRRDDYAKVSAIFHNRLERGMRLESDATVSYPLGVHRLVLTTQELETKNGFNTYTMDGLPVGPICNPSKAALQAARYPDTDYVYDGYLYFCTADPEKGTLAFAKTREEHLANVAQYRALWMAYDKKQEQ